MNRHVLTAATAVNRSWVTSTLRQRLIDRQANKAAMGQRRQLPHTVLANCWPHAEVRWPGVLGWPSLRWPWNSLRSVIAVLWPKRWTGYRHRWLNQTSRLIWTALGFGLVLVAIILAALITVVAVAGWLVANLVGFAAVARGWSSPMAFETILPADLDTDQALFSEDDEHDRNQLTADMPSADADLWDKSDRHDPHLAAQRQGIQELARHNDLLEQQQDHAPPAARSAPVITGQPTAASLPLYYYGARLRRPWGTRLAIWLFVASTIVGCLFSLTAVGLALWSANGGPQPPTNDELITSIHERTEARNQQRAADLADVQSNDGATP